MGSIMHGCKWVGTAVSIWLGVAGTAQARVLLLEDPYNPGEQIVVELKGCLPSEAGLEKLLPFLKQRQMPDVSSAPHTRLAMASPPRATHVSLPLLVGVGF
jgi:hypothetical protein